MPEARHSASTMSRGHGNYSSQQPFLPQERKRSRSFWSAACASRFVLRSSAFKLCAVNAQNCMSCSAIFSRCGGDLSKITAGIAMSACGGPIRSPQDASVEPALVGAPAPECVTAVRNLPGGPYPHRTGAPGIPQTNGIAEERLSAGCGLSSIKQHCRTVGSLSRRGAMRPFTTLLPLRAFLRWRASTMPLVFWTL